MSDSLEFNVDLSNYSGSLEILLDLAKSQKVDLENISITKLADQFHDFITKTENLNLELASEYLLMATWLTYLKSKLLLPETEEEEFKALEVAEKLKLQLKKLELIRLLSSQMLSRKRLGKDIFMRGSKSGMRSIYNSQYSLTLFELLKTYSNIVMTKDFQRMNIPKLPVFTTEEGIKVIKEFYNNLNDWKNMTDLIPKNFRNSKTLSKTGNAGIFAGSLELAKEGNISIKQDNLFEDIYIKKNLMNKLKKNNVVSFPSKLSDVDKEIEAIVFAAAEPLNIETIENKISKKTDVEKSLLKLQNFYSDRGINLVCISNKWSFRTSPNLSSLMSQQKTVEKNYQRLR